MSLVSKCRFLARLKNWRKKKEELIKLVSRYMNSARLGKEELKKAYGKAKAESIVDGSWVPMLAKVVSIKNLAMLRLT